VQAHVVLHAPGFRWISYEVSGASIHRDETAMVEIIYNEFCKIVLETKFGFTGEWDASTMDLLGGKQNYYGIPLNYKTPANVTTEGFDKHDCSKRLLLLLPLQQFDSSLCDSGN
jgi:hypothetical protein